MCVHGILPGVFCTVLPQVTDTRGVQNGGGVAKSKPGGGFGLPSRVELDIVTAALTGGISRNRVDKRTDVPDMMKNNVGCVRFFHSITTHNIHYVHLWFGGLHLPGVT